MNRGENRPGALSRDTFAAAAEPYRRSLKLHCYRMLGSLHEAEDAVQETLLKAWASLESFEQRSSLKNWLYRIATNTCLNALASRARRWRVLPDMLTGPSTELAADGPDLDTYWIDPYPTQEFEEVADPAPGPESRYELKEAIRLAFVAAIQYLPPRQRAAFILSDVLGWSPGEIALLLGGSVASINSILQRGRMTMRTRYSASYGTDRMPPSAERERDLLERYVVAWESRDLDGFVSLLREDATYEMPPRRQWFTGKHRIGDFFAKVWPHYGGFRLKPASANGQPAFGLYVPDRTTGRWQPHSLQVLTLTDSGILGLVTFMIPIGPPMFSDFRLPASL